MLVALARWWLTLIAGVLLGAGLVLHAQIAVAHHLRSEVQGTFFLWRGIGKLTFLFQDEVTKAALAIDEVPPSVMAEADRGAWVLVVIGSVLAVCALAVHKRKPSRRQA